MLIPLLHWWITSLGILGQGGAIDPQTLQTVAIVLLYPPALDGKTPMPKLMTPYSWILEHGDIKLGLTWKLHHSRVAFIVREGTMHTTEGEK